MPSLTVSNSTGGQLARCVVIPFARENLSVRATLVQVRNNADEEYLTSGVRLRTEHLLAVGSSLNNSYRAAAKDVNDVWSEFSAATNLTLGAYAAGATVASVGSGNAEDLEIEEPALWFPDLSMGSGQIWSHRTLVGGSMYDEQRRSKWSGRGRATFHVVLSELDEDQTALVHRFFRALNGPLTPFWFEYTDPNTDETERYVVRFRDPQITTELFGVTISRIDLHLVELIGASTGGEV